MTDMFQLAKDVNLSLHRIITWRGRNVRVFDALDCEDFACGAISQFRYSTKCAFTQSGSIPTLRYCSRLFEDNVLFTEVISCIYLSHVFSRTELCNLQLTDAVDSNLNR